MMVPLPDVQVSALSLPQPTNQVIPGVISLEEVVPFCQSLAHSNITCRLEIQIGSHCFLIVSAGVLLDPATTVT